MKKITITAVMFISFMNFILAQTGNNNAVQYSTPMQIDSSDFFLWGSLPDKTNKSKYVAEESKDRYNSFGNQNSLWTNVSVYDIKKQQLTTIFPSGLYAISPVYNTYLYNRFDYGDFGPGRPITGGTTNNYIIYLAKSDEYNKDGMIDESDPMYLYVSSKTGSDFRQVTPNGTNVKSWRQNRTGDVIMVVLQSDKNADKKFNDDNEIIYLIDLNKDADKIKLMPVTN
jgi:hypothetical protein